MDLTKMRTWFVPSVSMQYIDSVRYAAPETITERETQHCRYLVMLCTVRCAVQRAGPVSARAIHAHL